MERKDKCVWVYDIETLKSCFTYVAINVDTDEIVKYVIHKDRNDIDNLIKHLRECKGQVGFNNINFDYPVIHTLILEYNKNKEVSASEWIDILYNKAQSLINSQNQPNFFPSIRHKEVLIHQLDLFKIWHYDNKARLTSLKSLEISMNYPNVMDMPIDHTNENITIDDIDDILEYNLNDVLATFEFYKKSKHKIDLRLNIIRKYNIPCLNYSDSKIGESLLLSLYSNHTNKKPWDIKKLRTHRESIFGHEIIFPYIKFESKQFNDLLDFFNKLVIKNTKSAFKKSVIYKGFMYDYGAGGIHGCIKSGVYEAEEGYIIIDADVALKWRN